MEKLRDVETVLRRRRGLRRDCLQRSRQPLLILGFLLEMMAVAGQRYSGDLVPPVLAVGDDLDDQSDTPSGGKRFNPPYKYV